MRYCLKERRKNPTDNGVQYACERYYTRTEKQCIPRRIRSMKYKCVERLKICLEATSLPTISATYDLRYNQSYTRRTNVEVTALAPFNTLFP
jgi:hypothetical protein